MKPASETVHAFLRSIEVVDPAIESGLSRLDEPRAVETLRLLVIAHAKAHAVTASPLYADALHSLDALLRTRRHLSTKADALFTAAASRHPESKNAAEAAVVRWEWWTGSRYEPTPFDAERHHLTRGKKVAEPRGEQERQGIHAYGFDASGAVRVERSYNEIGHYETFYVHAADRLETFHYSYHRSEPINAVLFLLEDGRPIERHACATHGKSIERYAYDAGRIVRIDVESDGDSGFRSELLELTYDEAGELRALEQVHPASLPRTQLWSRPARSLTLARLLPLIRQHFLRLLPPALAQLHLEEPAYALAIALDGEAFDHLLPPSIGVGLASERDAFLAEHGAEAPRYLWSPPEWKRFDEAGLHLWDDRMAELATTANQMLWQGEKYALASRFAHSLAKELNGIDLPIPRTADFVVFACDFTCGDGIEGVKKAAPPALRKRLAPLLKVSGNSRTRTR